MELWIWIGGIAFVWWLWRRARRPAETSELSEIGSFDDKGSGVVIVAIGRNQAAESEYIAKKRSHKANNQRAARKQRKKGKGRWVPAGESVTIQGIEISIGRLYVGEWLQNVGASPYNDSGEPSLLNPQLPVHRKTPDPSGSSMSYWPFYAQISPGARASHLAFLRDGACDPRVYIGYVFLYYYGLERRILVDLETTPDTAELNDLFQEIERLLSIYGHNNSFRGYATSLLSYLAFKYDRPPNDSFLTLDEANRPSDLWLELGRRVRDGLPIEANLALAWLRSDPETRFRQPALRLADEFKSLFKLRFDQRHPDGLVLKPNKSRLSATYQPASGALTGRQFLAKSALPDLSRVKRPLEQFRSIVDWATDELAPYSRLKGRDPGRAETLAGYALLPAEILRQKTADPILHALLKFLRLRLDGQTRQVFPVSDLLVFWPQTEKLAKGDVVSLAQLLEKFDIGLEPDIRFGPHRIKPDGVVCLYRMSEPGGQTASQAYGSATAFLHLAALMAGADGTIDAQEQWQMEQHIKSQTILSSHERERLDAHLTWLLAAKPGLQGMKKRLEKLTPDKAQRLGHFLVSIAAADGRIDPAEVTLLEKIYAMINLEVRQVHTDLHAVQAAAPAAPAAPTDTLTVVPILDQPPLKEFSIPAAETTPLAAPTDGLQLNMARVNHIRAQTAAVQDILADVFSEDEVETPPPAPPARTIDLPLVEGLDHAHLHLFHALKEASTMARDSFDALCRELNLMPDGALELINDTAYDRFDEPVLTGEDPLEIDHKIAQELIA